MAMDSVFRVSLVLDMIDKMTGPAGQAGEKISSLGQQLDGAFAGVQRTGAVMTGAGTAILGAMGAITTSTFSTQNALAEVASLGVEDLGALEKAAKSFSDQYAGTTKADFISASYDIKSGIASLTDEGVAKYTELAALTAKATKASADDMTSLFATGYGIYKNYYSDLSDMEFGEMFSAGISTAVKNYKTSGTQMADAIKTIGATATNANVPMEEQLAILGQLQATMSGSEAGTRYRAFLNAAASAGEKLGLNFMDSNNQLMSTADIMDQLRTKYGDTIDAMEKQELKKAFGTDEAIAMIDLLYNNTDTLRKGVDDLKESMDRGTETTRQMADVINDTPEQKFTRLKQQMHNATEELAQGLLPSVNDGLTFLTQIVQKGSDWIANNQQLVGSIMRIVAIIGVVLLVGGVLTTTIGSIGRLIVNARGIISGLWGILAANPLGIVVGLLMALAAAFIITGGDFSGLAQIIQDGIPKLVSLVGGMASGLVQALITAAPGMLAAGQSPITVLVAAIGQYLPVLLQMGVQLILQLLSGVIQALPGIAQAGFSLILTLVSAIGQVLPGLVQTGISLILQLLSGILQAAPSLIAAVASLIPMAGSMLAQAAPTLVSTGINLAGQLILGILRGILMLLQAIPGLFGQLGSAILSIDWLGMGGEIIDGITEGFISGFTGLVDSAKGLWNDFTSWLGGGVEVKDEHDSKDGPRANPVGGFYTPPTQPTPAPAAPAAVEPPAPAPAPETAGVAAVLPPVTATQAVTVQTEANVDSSGATSAVNGMMNDLIENIKTGGSQAEGAAQDATGGVMDALSSISAGASGSMDLGGLMEQITGGITGGAAEAAGAAAEASGEIAGAFDFNAVAGNIDTSGLMAQITADITGGTTEAAGAAAEASSEIAGAFDFNAVAGNIDASGLMAQITADITGGTGTAQAAAGAAGQSVTASFQTGTAGAGEAASTMMTRMTAGITGGTPGAAAAMGNAGRNALQAFRSATASAGSDARSVMARIRGGIISGGAGAVSAARSIASQISSAFRNIRVTVPRPRIPVVSVYYTTVGEGEAKAKVPHFSVHYNAKGAILNAATLLGFAGGRAEIGGEAGPEAVLPIDTLWEQMEEKLTGILGRTFSSDERGNRKRTDDLKSALKQEPARAGAADRGSKRKEQIKQFIVQRLNLTVDIDAIEDIDKMKKLIEQIEELTGGDPALA